MKATNQTKEAGQTVQAPLKSGLTINPLDAPQQGQTNQTKEGGNKMSKALYAKAYRLMDRGAWPLKAVEHLVCVDGISRNEAHLIVSAANKALGAARRAKTDAADAAEI